MRILFVTAAYLPMSIGGVELHVANLARVMRERGHEPAVFTRGADPKCAEFSLERTAHDAVPVFRLDYKFSDCKDFRGIVVNSRIRAEFERVLGEFAPDVVHVHHLTCLSTDLIDAAKDRGIPVVMTLHDFWMGCPRGQRMTPDLELCHDIDLERCVPCLTKMWSGWFGVGRDGPQVASEDRQRRDLEQLRSYHAWIGERLAQVDVLVTPSDSSRRIFGRQLATNPAFGRRGFRVENIRMIENGLDLAAFRKVERRAHERFRFGFLGTVLPTKGVHVLLEAFLALDGDAELHVHGEAPPWHEVTGYGDRLRARAVAAGERGSRVHFHGRYEAAQVPGILAELDCLVVPSLWFEAFCLTLREGFLGEVPVIVSDLGAMAEAIVTGEEALTFPPGDGGELRRRMEEVLRTGSLRERLIRSRKHVRSIEDNAAELLAVYREQTRGEVPA